MGRAELVHDEADDDEGGACDLAGGDGLVEDEPRGLPLQATRYSELGNPDRSDQLATNPRVSIRPKSSAR